MKTKVFWKRLFGFKVGDKVKVIDELLEFGGKTGRIDKIYPKKAIFQYRVIIGGHAIPFREKELEYVEEES